MSALSLADHVAGYSPSPCLPARSVAILVGVAARPRVPQSRPGNRNAFVCECPRSVIRSTRRLGRGWPRAAACWVDSSLWRCHNGTSPPTSRRSGRSARGDPVEPPETLSIAVSDQAGSGASRSARPPMPTILPTRSLVTPWRLTSAESSGWNTPAPSLPAGHHASAVVALCEPAPGTSPPDRDDDHHSGYRHRTRGIESRERSIALRRLLGTCRHSRPRRP